MFVNSAVPVVPDYAACDATGLAKEAGAVVVANLVLLGYAAQAGALFCTTGQMERVIHRISQAEATGTEFDGLSERPGRLLKY